MTIYFTSDTHYGHANIIKYCLRPFRDVAEMDAIMIQRWREIVTEEDEVWHLGDFAFAKPPRLKEVLGQLPGHKHLVRGNHDRRITDTQFLAAGFETVCEDASILLDGKWWHLEHIPQKPTDWYPGSVGQLCGHVHIDWAVRNRVINVGVDVSDFRPMTFEQLKARKPYERPVAVPVSGDPAYEADGSPPEGDLG